MSNESTMTWPFLRLALPQEADADQIALLTQAAADVGALGSSTEPSGELLVYLPKEAGQDMVQMVFAALRNEAHELGWPEPALNLERLEEQPWATAWKQAFVTMPIGKRLLIRPDWELHESPPTEWSDRHPIYLRPGSGFGTGRHETTRLALEMLENHITEGDRVLDFGSGSGVLSIAAVRLGASSVTAVEFDVDANQNARENFDLNGCHARIYLQEKSHPREAPGKFDLILCNMLPHNAMPHLYALVERLAGPQSLLIYSGFLVEQQSDITEAFHQAGLMPQASAQLNEWGALVAELGSHAHE